MSYGTLWPAKDEEQDDGNQKFDVINDWDKLVGGQLSSTKPKELTQYLKEQGIGTRHN
jgi:hypothetical protein